MLERNRAHILREEEKCWRLRSRATWLKWGDSNTKFFHNLASHNRNKKQIWSIQSDCDETLREQEAIKAEAVTILVSFSKPTKVIIFLRKLPLPAFIQNWYRPLKRPTSISQSLFRSSKDILIHFKKERSPGPDGWTTEFFSFFFDLVGSDLLQMVEDTRIKGKIQKVLTPPSWY
jgi:hypothetical protein